MLWYSSEVPHWGASNEYPQHMSLLRNKKHITWIPSLIWNYEQGDNLGYIHIITTVTWSHALCHFKWLLPDHKITLVTQRHRKNSQDIIQRSDHVIVVIMFLFYILKVKLWNSIHDSRKQHSTIFLLFFQNVRLNISYKLYAMHSQKK